MKKIYFVLIVAVIMTSVIACGEGSGNGAISSDVANENSIISNPSDISGSSCDVSGFLSSSIESDNSNIAESYESEDSVDKEESEIIFDNDNSSDSGKKDDTYPYDYDSWNEFEQYESDYYVRLFNPEKLETLFDITLYSSKRDQYYILSDNDAPNDEVWITVYPLTDTSIPAWHKSMSAPMFLLVNDPSEELTYFPVYQNCYHYIKEGVDMYMVGAPKDAFAWVESDEGIYNLSVLFKIDGFIFKVFLSPESNEETPLFRERSYPSLETLESLKPQYEDAMWKYELLNVYNEDSQLVALLKEMVAEQS